MVQPSEFTLLLQYTTTNRRMIESCPMCGGPRYPYDNTTHLHAEDGATPQKLPLTRSAFAFEPHASRCGRRNAWSCLLCGLCPRFSTGHAQNGIATESQGGVHCSEGSQNSHLQSLSCLRRRWQWHELGLLSLVFFRVLGVRV